MWNSSPFILHNPRSILAEDFSFLQTHFRMDVCYILLMTNLDIRALAVQWLARWTWIPDGEVSNPSNPNFYIFVYHLIF